MLLHDCPCFDFRPTLTGWAPHCELESWPCCELNGWAGRSAGWIVDVDNNNNKLVAHDGKLVDDARKLDVVVATIVAPLDGHNGEI
ncbi:hypothetical protein A2U01_0006993 [Trifolium medium]|uniref:Uncharacterized protein n=1 Tax=Trifolium medium TaxID=97028 RepID=A0A392MGG4_9FABA|nr:hypothetical protein [Trifolium medium]